MAKESLLPHQLKLLKSITPVTVMMGGRGIGKSQAASRLILKKIAEGKSCLVSGPTYKQLKISLPFGADVSAEEPKPAEVSAS